MTRARLEALCRITATVSRARQAEMAALRRRDVALRQRLTEIEEARARSLATLDPEAPAMRAGAVMAWQVWVDRQRVGLNGELALVRAHMLACRERLAEAHGRDRAMTALAGAVAQEEDRTDRRRRDNAGG